MDRFQIENIYEANGLNNYKLRDTTDLQKCHGVDYTAVPGYDRLDDLNRSIYEKFIINFFNAQGLESRATIVPRGIYFVEDVELLVKEDPTHDYYNIAGGIVTAIYRDGTKAVLHRWKDKEYQHLEQTKGEPKTYLRFEYQHLNRKEWLHVLKEGKDWY